MSPRQQEVRTKASPGSTQAEQDAPGSADEKARTGSVASVPHSRTERPDRGSRETEFTWEREALGRLPQRVARVVYARSSGSHVDSDLYVG